jgi:hypothetical protein
MNVIDHNPDKTVGIVEKVDGLEHIGGFSHELMVEWLQAIEAAFEIQRTTTIHLFVKKSDCEESYALFACSEGEDPLVALAGKLPADGKPWGKVYVGDKK